MSRPAQVTLQVLVWHLLWNRVGGSSCANLPTIWGMMKITVMKLWGFYDTCCHHQGWQLAVFSTMPNVQWQLCFEKRAHDLQDWIHTWPCVEMVKQIIRVQICQRPLESYGGIIPISGTIWTCNAGSLFNRHVQGYLALIQTFFFPNHKNIDIRGKVWTLNLLHIRLYNIVQSYGFPRSSSITPR